MSTIFYLPGDDPLAHLRQKMVHVAPPAFAGQWCCVELRPDVFGMQKFVIGIVVIASEGIHFRLVSDSAKFECVYGKKVGAAVREWVESAERTLHRARKGKASSLNELEFEFDGLSLSPAWHTSGSSPEESLQRLFDDVVVMEPRDERQPKGFVTLDTEQVRQLVYSELRKLAGLRFEEIVVPSQHIVAAVEGEAPHVLDFDLRKEGGAGAVVSAVYKTPSTVELNLLRASRDLSTFGKVRRLSDLAVFMMTSVPSQMEPAEYAKISDVIDEQTWCLERQGFRVVAFEEPTLLANSVLEWAA